MRTLLLTIALSLSLGCNTLKDKAELPAPGTPTKEQAQAMAEQAKAQGAYQNRMMEMQLDVTKKCVERGWVPVLTNGNVDCKNPKP